MLTAYSIATTTTSTAADVMMSLLL